MGAQLAVFALIAGLSWRIERRRPAAVTPPTIAPIPFTLLRGPWPLLAGAAGLAALNALTLWLAGHPWSITWAFSLWGGKVLQGAGVDLSQAAFWSGVFQQRALQNPILADITSVMDIGIVVGAGLAAGLAGRFAPALAHPLARRGHCPVRRLAIGLRRAHCLRV